MPNPSTIAMHDEESRISMPSMTPTPNYDIDVDAFARELRVLRDGGGDTSQAFFYLAGPMSGIPAFNFPAFHAASAKLRDCGYNLVSPAELDYEIERRKAEESPNGHSTTAFYHECLRRDLRIVLNPNLVGVICLDGWENSRGAQAETFVADWFEVPLYAYSEDEHGDPYLEQFDREGQLS